jgi:hypothetical protein
MGTDYSHSACVNPTLHLSEPILVYAKKGRYSKTKQPEKKKKKKNNNKNRTYFLLRNQRFQYTNLPFLKTKTENS